MMTQRCNLAPCTPISQREQSALLVSGRVDECVSAGADGRIRQRGAIVVGRDPLLLLQVYDLHQHTTDFC